MTRDELTAKLQNIGMSPEQIAALDEGELEFVSKAMPASIPDETMRGLLSDADVVEALDSGDGGLAAHAIEHFLKGAGKGKGEDDDEGDDKEIDEKIKSAAKDLFGEDEGDDDEDEDDEDEGDDEDDEDEGDDDEEDEDEGDDEEDMEKGLSSLFPGLDEDEDVVDLSIEDLHKSIHTAVRREQEAADAKFAKRFSRIEKGLANLTVMLQDMGTLPAGRSVAPYRVPGVPAGDAIRTATLMHKSIIKAVEQQIVSGDQAIKLLKAVDSGPDAVAALTSQWGIELPE